MTVVTISAAYGAGGSEIGPAVAAELGVPFVDRAIPATVARRLGVTVEDAEAKDENVATGLWRLISSMAMVPDLSGTGPLVYNAEPDERAFREKTEQVLNEIAQSSGGVILGRAAAIVLRDVPGALHVRLDAEEKVRVQHMQEVTGEDEATVWQALRDNDSARAGYVRHFYRVDATDFRLYHLVIDSIALSHSVVTDLIVRAARGRGES